jgi:hypothetical protein
MEIEKNKNQLELMKKLKNSDKNFYEKTIFQRENEKVSIMRQIQNLEEEIISINNFNTNNENYAGYTKTDESIKNNEIVKVILIKQLNAIEEKIKDLNYENVKLNHKSNSLKEANLMMKEEKSNIEMMIVNLISLKESLEEMLEEINIFEKGTEAFEHFVKHLENMTKDTHMEFHVYEMNIIEKPKFIQNLYKYFENLEVRLNVGQFKKICENSFNLMKNNEFLEMSDFFHLLSKKIQDLLNTELNNFEHKNMINIEVTLFLYKEIKFSTQVVCEDALL